MLESFVAARSAFHQHCRLAPLAALYPSRSCSLLHFNIADFLQIASDTAVNVHGINQSQGNVELKYRSTNNGREALA